MRSFLLFKLFAPVILIILIYSSCNQAKKGEESSLQNYASLSDSAHYLGKEACKECHADKYETFMQTGMGMSFDSATQQKSSGRFSPHDIIHDTYRNLSYFPHWENGKMVLTEFRLNGKDTVYKRDEEISYIVGSGQHTNSHMISINGYVYQAPATFYTQKGQWDLPPGFENGFNSRFSRRIELECMSCHNAYPKITEGSANKYEMVPRGIDCERCHGPGSVHIAEMKSGKTVDVKKAIDFSIVNPAKLDISRQLDICQRCHIQGNAVLAKDKSWFDFRPGMHLSDVMNVFMPVYKGAEDEHIMASHAERMKLSACYRSSVEKAEAYNQSHPTLEPYREAMTCVTCHNPHISVRSTDRSVFNAACVNCHSGEGKPGHPNPVIHAGNCTMSIAERMKSGNSCVNCHMPKNGTIDIPHVTTTDHWIRKAITKSEAAKIREFVGLSCVNNPGVDDKSKGIAYLSYYEKFVSSPAFLDSAKKYLKDGSGQEIENNFNELIRWAFLKDDYEQVLVYVAKHHAPLEAILKKSFTNDDAWTAYRIAESYKKKGSMGNALIYMKKAVELAFYIPEFRNKLAGLQFDLGIFDDAEKNYRFLINENPDFVSAFVNYGYFLLSVRKDPVKARSMYEKALSLDPDNIQALMNMAGLNLFEGNREEAGVYFRKVLAIDPKNEQVIRMLKSYR